MNELLIPFALVNNKVKKVSNIYKQDEIFCLECGEKVVAANIIICPECGKTVMKDKFCPECGTRCEGKFCMNCGTKLDS